jgi:hypothetical protein
MVPEAGLEPARYFYRGILSPLCLPIPPLGLVNWYQFYWFIILLYNKKSLKMEAEAGIEPALTALQAAA